jgi:phosphomannomutase
MGWEANIVCPPCWVDVLRKLVEGSHYGTCFFLHEQNHNHRQRGDSHHLDLWQKHRNYFAFFDALFVFQLPLYQQERSSRYPQLLLILALYRQWKRKTTTSLQAALSPWYYSSWKRRCTTAGRRVTGITIIDIVLTTFRHGKCDLRIPSL